MKLRLSNQFALILLLFVYASASPVDTQEGVTKFDELADMNKILRNAVEINNFTTPVFMPHRDGDETVGAINLESVPNLKYDVELLESEDLKKESDGVEEHFRGAALHLDTNIFTDEDIEVHKINDPRPISYIALMTIFTIFGLVVLLIYATLITWRRKADQVYGQRVLLVSNCDDDDYMHRVHNTDYNRRVYQLESV